MDSDLTQAEAEQQAQAAIPDQGALMEQFRAELHQMTTSVRPGLNQAMQFQAIRAKFRRLGLKVLRRNSRDEKSTGSGYYRRGI